MWKALKGLSARYLNKYTFKGAKMIKKIIMAPLFCLTSSIAGAQVEVPKPVICFPVDQLLKEIKELGDEPKWAGTAPDGKSKYLLVVNKDKSWALIQFNDKLGCVLGVGKDSQLFFKGI
jgi:hypothetical protein